MATFRNRDGKWQARVRRLGYAAITKSFITLQDAEKWARFIEVDLDKNSYNNTNLAEKTTLKDLIERYMREVTPSMRGASEDLIRLKAIARRPLSQTNMLALTPSKIAECCKVHGARRPESIKRGKDQVNFVHGRRTLEAKLEQSATSRRLQQLEDALHLLKMTTAKRSRGRKALGYSPITSLDEIKKAIK
jgi:hypothetical protein